MAAIESKYHESFWDDRRALLYEGKSYAEIGREHGTQRGIWRAYYVDRCRRERIEPTRKSENWLILGCVHVPFQNPVLWPKILQLIKDMGGHIYGIVLNGDFMDLNSLSSHDKGNTPIEGIDLSFEYSEGRKQIANLVEAATNGTKLVYMYGNHEDRWLRRQKQIDNAKLGNALPEPCDALYLDDYGFEVYRSWTNDYITLGEHLDVTHGQFHGIHAAKTHLDRNRGSILFNHTHRVQSFVTGEMGAYNCGWLGDIDSPAFGYASRMMKKNWQNGFAMVNIDDHGDYHVNTINCLGGKFFYNGVLY